MEASELGSLQAALLRNADSPKIIRFRVRGGSMRPTVWSGWTVEVERAVLTDCRPGEIVLWCEDDERDQWVLHRLVQVERSGSESTFQTRGDGRIQSDRVVPADALFGRLVSVHAGGFELRPDRGVYGAANKVVAAAALHAPGLLEWLATGIRSAGALRRALGQYL